MRIAALYDIHGNLPALRAVLAEAEREGIDRFVIGGDVATGPLPAETLDRLLSLGDRALFVMGNADREALEAHERAAAGGELSDAPVDPWVRFTASRLSPVHRELIASFAPIVELEIDGLGAVLFCHGSPGSDSEILTRVTPDLRLRSVLAGVPQPTVVCGHTHQQFDRRLDGWRVINAGSVGMPYEGTAAAFWATFGPEVTLRRTDYDVAQALAELRAGSADADELLAESLIAPVDPGEVASFFEGQIGAEDDPAR